MASIGPKYTKSAVDVISPMLTINQQLQSRNDNSWNRLMTGTKGLSEGIGNVIMVKKRSDDIKYKGDDYIAQLKSEKAELEAELKQVQNEMRTIRAEDNGSLDQTLVQPTNTMDPSLENMPTSGRRNMSSIVEDQTTHLQGNTLSPTAKFNMYLDDAFNEDINRTPNRTRGLVDMKLREGRY